MSLVACGENNTATPDADVSRPSTQEQTVTISSDWLGTYHSTDGEQELVLTVSGEGGAAIIGGSALELTARAEYANEIQLIDGDGSVVPLTRFSNNSVDKRYDFAVTAKDDPATHIISSTFLVQATVNYGEQQYAFNIEDVGDGSWRMRVPCEGYCYPE